MTNLRGKRRARSPSPSIEVSRGDDLIPPAKRSRTSGSTFAGSCRLTTKTRTATTTPADLLELASRVEKAVNLPSLSTEDVKDQLIEQNHDLLATVDAILVAEQNEQSELSEGSECTEGGAMRSPDSEASIPISELTDEESTSLISELPDFNTGRMSGASFSPQNAKFVPSSIKTASNVPERSLAIATQDAITASASASGNGRSRSRLLALPRELRDQIYTALLVYNGAAYIQQAKFNLAVTSTPTFPLAIARVCKQMQEECLKVFYSGNNFTLDLNILSCVDWLSSLPASVKGKISNISLSKTTMTGYIRYDLGLYDSSRLRSELVKKLVYDLDIPSISLDVPEEPTPPTGPNGGLRSFLSFSPPTDYSWSLCREFVEVLLSGGAASLRLCYPTLHTPETLANALKLSAVSKFLYLDDEFEVDSNIKRHEQARLAGKRPEFKSKDDVEKWVRARRARRSFGVRYVERKAWEHGSVVEIVRPNEGEERVVEGLGMGPSRRRRHREEYRWSVG